MRPLRLVCLALSSLAAGGLSRSQNKNVVPTVDNLVITKDTTLKPGVYKIRDADKNGAIQITKDGVTLDGNGATIDGTALEGIGVFAENVKNVTIKNLTVRGYATGVKLAKVQDCVVEKNVLSENFSNPAAQWGNGDLVAGLVLEDATGCKIRDNVAMKNWNGILLTRCNRNIVQTNNASHVDNWGLRLWRSSENQIKENDFSYAMRCEKEAHACDSAAILIESGSDRNRVDHNNATHSGDGIFIRALDAIVSQYNVFSSNDVSFAHNNGFECWCPRNTFKNNKANRCGYGFWLGSSDSTWVEANEVKENGVEGTNSANGTAGIAYIGGGSNVNIQFNTIEGNAGPGIHVKGNPPAFPAVHMLIQQNTIKENGEGIRVEVAEFCDIRSNYFAGNKKQPDVNLGEKCVDIVVKDGPPFRSQKVPPTFVQETWSDTRGVGESIEFEIKEMKSYDGRKPTVRWNFGDGTKDEGSTVKHAFGRPGFYRVSIFVDDGTLAATGQILLYIVNNDPEFTDLSSAKWGGEAVRWANGFVRLVDDVVTKVKGRSSVHAVTNAGEDVVLTYPRTRDAAWNLTSRRALQMWVKFRNDNDNSFQNSTPTIRLVDSRVKGDEKSYFEYKPKSGNLLGLTVPYSEGRWLFNFLEIPLTGDAVWERTVAGNPDLRHIDAVEIHADTWGAGFELWLDGVSFVK